MEEIPISLVLDTRARKICEARRAGGGATGRDDEKMAEHDEKMAEQAVLRLDCITDC